MTDQGGNQSQGIVFSETKTSLFDLYGKLGLSQSSQFSNRPELEIIDEICSVLHAKNMEEIQPLLTANTLNIHLSDLWKEYAKRCGGMEDGIEGDQRFLALVHPFLEKPDVLNFVLLRIAPWAGAFGVERAEELLQQPLRSEIWKLRLDGTSHENHEEILSAMRNLDLEHYFRLGVMALASHFVRHEIMPPDSFQLSSLEFHRVVTSDWFNDPMIDLEFIARLQHPQSTDLLLGLLDIDRDRLPHMIDPNVIAELLGRFFPDFVRERMTQEILRNGHLAKSYLYAFHYVNSKKVVSHLVDVLAEYRHRRNGRQQSHIQLHDVLDLLLHQDRIEEILGIIKESNESWLEWLHYQVGEHPESIAKLVSTWFLEVYKNDPSLARQLLVVLYRTGRFHSIDPTILSDVYFNEEKEDYFEQDPRIGDISWKETILSLVGRSKDQKAACRILARELNRNNGSMASQAIRDNGLVYCFAACEEHLENQKDPWISVKSAILLANGKEFDSVRAKNVWKRAIGDWNEKPVSEELRIEMFEALRKADPEFIARFLQETQFSNYDATYMEIPLVSELVSRAVPDAYQDWLIRRFHSLMSARRDHSHRIQVELPDGDLDDITDEFHRRCRKWLSLALIAVDTQWVINNLHNYGVLFRYLSGHSLMHNKLYFQEACFDESGVPHNYADRPAPGKNDAKESLAVEDLTLYWRKAENGDYEVRLQTRYEIIAEFKVRRKYSDQISNQWILFDLMIKKGPRGPSFYDILERIEPASFNEYFRDPNSNEKGEQYPPNTGSLRENKDQEMNVYAHHEKKPQITAVR